MFSAFETTTMAKYMTTWIKDIDGGRVNLSFVMTFDISEVGYGKDIHYDIDAYLGPYCKRVIGRHKNREDAQKDLDAFMTSLDTSDTSS